MCDLVQLYNSQKGAICVLNKCACVSTNIATFVFGYTHQLLLCVYGRMQHVCMQDTDGTIHLILSQSQIAILSAVIVQFYEIMLHQILLLLSGTMRLVKRSSHCFVNSTCLSALAKGRMHGAMNQTNTKVICYPERQTAITISVTSHWLNHLFFNGATSMENTFNLHVYEMKKRVDGGKYLNPRFTYILP